MRDLGDNQTRDWMSDWRHKDREARQLRDAGIRQAVDHADSVTEGWSIRAYKTLLHYLRVHKRGDRITSERFREFAVWYVESPPDARAWGGVIRRAATAQLIAPDGYEPVTTPGCHKRPGTVWRVL